MSVTHFVDPDLEVEICFKKEGATEEGGIDFEVGYWGTSALVEGLEEAFMHTLSPFLLFFRDTH